MEGESRAPELERERQFRLIFDACYGPVSGYARRRCSSLELAQDAVSETFLVVWRRLDDVPRGSSTLPWLYGVARRVIANQRRGSRRQADLSARLAGEVVRLGPTGPRDTDAGLIASEQRRAVLRALSRLRERDREILRLSVWEELSHREIGQVVGCSEAAVAVRLHRARARLASEFEKGGGRSGHDPVTGSSGHGEEASDDG